jgi:hypothetical protein
MPPKFLQYRVVWLWLLWHLPAMYAVPLATWLQSRGNNHSEDGLCLLCQAASRIKAARHDFTEGIYSGYCSKCGLPKSKWPTYCANKVVQVNNKPRLKAAQRHKQLFW